MTSVPHRHPVRFIAAAVCCAWLTCDAANVDELNDLAARLQFDYYAGNARALQQDLQQLAKLEPEAASARAQNYQLSYGQWKLAQTLRAQDRSGAKRAADACVAAADRGLEAVPKRASIPRPDVMHAELHAIQAACFDMLADLSGVESSRFAKSIEAARSLQPANPRVLLVGAVEAVGRAKSAAELNAVEKVIAAAVAAFDAQGPSLADAGDWGQAEALAWLGDVQLRQGNRIGARNSLERSLVIAPDYIRARELLARVTGGR